jgi:hypothetical protein
MIAEFYICLYRLFVDEASNNRVSIYSIADE